MNPRLLALVLSCLLVATGVLAVVAGRLDGRPPAHADGRRRDRRRAEVEALAVLSAWDQRRSRAWASGDPAALRGLYAAGSRSGRAGPRAAGGVRRSRAAGDRPADAGAGGRVVRGRPPTGSPLRGHRPAGRRRRRRPAASGAPLPRDRPSTRPVVAGAGRGGVAGRRRFRPARPASTASTSRSREPVAQRPRARPGRGSASPAAPARAGPAPTSSSGRRARTANAGRCTARASASVNSALVGVSGQQRLNGPAAVVVLGQDTRPRPPSRAARPSGSTARRLPSRAPRPSLEERPQLPAAARRRAVHDRRGAQDAHPGAGLDGRVGGVLPRRGSPGSGRRRRGCRTPR